MESTSLINSNPNPIFGFIVNLFYKESDTNVVSLVSIVVQDYSGEIYTLSNDPNINADCQIIEVTNLKNFQFKLQEAFNFKSSVNIYLQNNKIDSLILMENEGQGFSIDSDTMPSSAKIRGASGGGRARCHYGKPPCR